MYSDEEVNNVDKNVDKNEHFDTNTRRFIVKDCTYKVNPNNSGRDGIHYQHYYTRKVRGIRNICIFCKHAQFQVNMKQVEKYENKDTGDSYYYYNDSTHRQKYMKYKNKYLNLKKLSQL